MARIILWVIAAICFIIALLILTSVVNSGNGSAWAVGGLLSWLLSVAPAVPSNITVNRTQ